MPPRSFYLDPRPSDYQAVLTASLPDDAERSRDFMDQYSVPLINHADHLAAYIGISASLIRQILHQPAYHYRKFSIEKPDGTEREISTPKTYLKVIQWWVLDNILEKHVCSEAVHGFRRGRSYITNAATHVGSNHILNVDIQRFFPNIDKAKVINVFSGFGYSEDGAELLASLVTLQNEAPTGAPTSPMIGNIVLADFDREIETLALALGIRYTRYADDLTFSATERIEDDFFNSVREKVRQHGFQLNDRKSRFMGRGNRMEVTGAVINDGVNTPRIWRNTARGLLHRAQLNPENFLEQFDLISGIYGTLLSVDPECQKPLTAKARHIVHELRSRRSNREKPAGG